MAKHEWGTKHTCSTCEAVFYDMKKPGPSCPSCDTKVKSTRSPSPPPPKPTPKKAEASALDLEAEDDLAMDDNQDDKELLEQVEDDVEDDMKEVIETGTAGEATD